VSLQCGFQRNPNTTKVFDVQVYGEYAVYGKSILPYMEYTPIDINFGLPRRILGQNQKYFLSLNHFLKIGSNEQKKHFTLLFHASVRITVLKSLYSTLMQTHVAKMSAFMAASFEICKRDRQSL
jgi:hypothetical protein